MSNTNTVPQGLFGPGILWVRRTDISNATPTNIGYVNEFSFDIKFDLKELYGQKQLPLLVARGTAKVTGKIKAATLSGQALNAVLLGQSWTTGTQYDTATLALSIPATTPFTLTPAVPSSGTFYKDLGVTDGTTGESLALVASAPATGQYSVAAGTYTFAAADEGKAVVISFAYSFSTGATGQNLTIANEDIGTTPTFELVYKTELYGATYFLNLFQCVGGSLSLGHKLTDFAMPEYDLSAFANAAQQIGIISVATVS